jgi:hypothetical protein
MIWSFVLWGFVILLIPAKRIRELWPVSFISVILLLVFDFTSIHLGLYRFNDNLINIGGIPFFYLMIGAAGGLLLLYFMRRVLLYNILIMVLYTGLLILAEYMFIRIGAFQHLDGYNLGYSFLLTLSGVIATVLLAIGVIGKERIFSYNGEPSKISREPKN